MFITQIRRQIALGEGPPPKIVEEKTKNIDKYFKYFVIVTLKSVMHSMLTKVILHQHPDKMTSALSIIVNAILHHLKAQSVMLAKEESQRNIDKNQGAILEALTDFFATLLEKAKMLVIKQYKKEISDLFLSDSFFNMTRRSFKNWSKIIYHFITQEKNEVFEDLLYKWNTQAGMFTSKTYELQQKCIALKRISFLVYAGEADHYEDQIQLLLKKMAEGFKQTPKSKELQIQLFLLTRVLLLRLSPQTLAEALRKLWPHLLNELVFVFEQQKENYELIIEAIKIVELMSCLNIEDFHMNQWIFLVDAYGMKGPDSSINRQNQMPPAQKQNMASPAKKPDGTEVGIFQPFITKYMDPWSKGTFFNEAEPSHEQAQARQLQIKVSPKDYVEELLFTYTTSLQFHLDMYNLEKSELDRSNAENLIEKDFIEL